ncbi:MAG: hypothetical protein KJ559_00105 [Nanoarchaeota archaeon]|nr:hypothetical protein [Nanoarchaeota archaeon]
MVSTILQSEFVTELILPFLLVFTVIFAILDKTKILGDKKRQINAITSFVIALIFISFSNYVGLTIKLMGFMAVIAIILLVFIFLISFVGFKDDKFEMGNKLKYTLWILISAALVIAVLVFTGFWETIWNSISGGNAIIMDIVFVLVIVIAVVIVLATGKESSSSSSS